MLNVIAIDHDVQGGERALAICGGWWRGCECVLRLAQHLGGLCVCVCARTALGSAQGNEEMFPSSTTNDMFQFWNTALTISLMPYFFLKTKDIAICECFYFLFVPANEEKFFFSQFPPFISRSRGWESGFILLLLSSLPLLILAPQFLQPVHTPFAS